MVSTKFFNTTVNRIAEVEIIGNKTLFWHEWNGSYIEFYTVNADSANFTIPTLINSFNASSTEYSYDTVQLVRKDSIVVCMLKLDNVTYDSTYDYQFLELNLTDSSMNISPIISNSTEREVHFTYENDEYLVLYEGEAEQYILSTFNTNFALIENETINTPYMDMIFNDAYFHDSKVYYPARVENMLQIRCFDLLTEEDTLVCDFGVFIQFYELHFVGNYLIVDYEEDMDKYWLFILLNDFSQQEEILIDFFPGEVYFVSDQDGLLLLNHYASIWMKISFFSYEDSDMDGVSDFQEMNQGTDPLNRDSDGDLIPDGLEIELNTNPLLGISNIYVFIGSFIILFTIYRVLSLTKDKLLEKIEKKEEEKKEEKEKTEEKESKESKITSDKLQKMGIKAVVFLFEASSLFFAGKCITSIIYPLIPPFPVDFISPVLTFYLLAVLEIFNVATKRFTKTEKMFRRKLKHRIGLFGLVGLIFSVYVLVVITNAVYRTTFMFSTLSIVGIAGAVVITPVMIFLFLKNEKTKLSQIDITKERAIELIQKTEQYEFDSSYSSISEAAYKTTSKSIMIQFFRLVLGFSVFYVVNAYIFISMIDISSFLGIISPTIKLLSANYFYIYFYLFMKGLLWSPIKDERAHIFNSLFEINKDVFGKGVPTNQRISAIGRTFSGVGILGIFLLSYTFIVYMFVYIFVSFIQNDISFTITSLFDLPIKLMFSINFWEYTMLFFLLLVPLVLFPLTNMLILNQHETNKYKWITSLAVGIFFTFGFLILYMTFFFTPSIATAYPPSIIVWLLGDYAQFRLYFLLTVFLFIDLVILLISSIVDKKPKSAKYMGFLALALFVTSIFLIQRFFHIRYEDALFFRYWELIVIYFFTTIALIYGMSYRKGRKIRSSLTKSNDIDEGKEKTSID